MAVNINNHIEAMEQLQALTIATLKTVRRRNNTRLEMAQLAVEQGDPSIALDPAQIAGLIADQLADTQALQAPLNEAIASMTP